MAIGIKRLRAARVVGGWLLCCGLALAQGINHGVLVHLRANGVAQFDARHNTRATRLNPNRDLYLVTVANPSTDHRTDAQLLQELSSDPAAGRPELNVPVKMSSGQSTASVLNSEQSTASVLNFDDDDGIALDQSTASVLNVTEVNYFGTRAPLQYVQQPVVDQIHAGDEAHDIATGRGAVVALIDNGVDPFNPVLRRVLLARAGYNFYDNSRNWSAFADLAQSTASVLNSDQSTASVLNGSGSGSNGPCTSQSTASVLNQSTASVLNDDDQSTASVLNDDQSTASVLNALSRILACNPDFGHGTSVAGLIHLVAPEARILPIKAFGPDGTALASVIYQSLTYAIDQRVDVMNLSFSATDTTPDIRDAMAEAVGDGIVIAAAAGNSDSSAAVYPASLPGVVGVGAVDGSGADPLFPRASFSNFDPASGIVDADVAAPGVSLFTTYPGFGLIWATVSGTSFSAPLAAGEAALLAELHQRGAASRGAIEATSDPAIAGDLQGELGHGMIQVLGALKSVPDHHRR